MKRDKMISHTQTAWNFPAYDLNEDDDCKRKKDDDDLHVDIQPPRAITPPHILTDGHTLSHVLVSLIFRAMSLFV